MWNDCLCEALPLTALQQYQERMSGRGPRGWSHACRYPGCKVLDNGAPQMVGQDLWDKKTPPKLVISKIQVSQKLHFKADEALYILSFRWTMICTDLQLLHWRSCYGTTEISSAIESGWCEGIQNRDQISDQFTLSFLGFFLCKCNRKEEEREGMTCS